MQYAWNTISKFELICISSIYPSARGEIKPGVGTARVWRAHISVARH